MPTVTIQPSTQDATVFQNNPAQNYGPSQGITYHVGYSSASLPNPWRRAYIQFNLSSIPAGAKVSVATLRLYLTAVWDVDPSRLFVIQRAAGAWDHNAITWNNQPNGTSTNEVAHTGPTAAGAWMEQNILAITRDWVESGISNTGLHLRMHSEATNPSNNKMYHYAGHNYTDGYRPQLIITYNQPPSAPTGLAPAGTSHTLSQTVAFSWTHNDPDGDAQNAYEIRWRRSGSADAYSTLTATTSTQSRNEPATTFGVGTWEYNVRTKDTGTSTFGAWSSTQTFTVTGIERWGVVHI